VAPAAEPPEPVATPRERAADGRSSRRRHRPVTLRGTAVAVLAAVGAAHFARPERPLLSPPDAVAAVTEPAHEPRTPFGRVAKEAFGRSGEVRMRFTLPGENIAVPLLLFGDTVALAYAWIPVADSTAPADARPLEDAERLVAPEEPGFYRLALVRDGRRRILDDVTVTVLVPFAEKRGALLRGFRLGTYVGERRGASRAGLPEGFFAVDRELLSLPVSRHLRLRDVLTTPDTPARGYPQYATIDTRLVEKLELVIAEVMRQADRPTSPRVTVNSGFRPPSYNATVRGAARNSRHQYGDAADVKIDVNRDGRFSLAEVRLVQRAVEAVERAHPDLAGGMGVYTGGRLRQPYVHIDARGTRARWTGAG
jgi:hypothetical protein